MKTYLALVLILTLASGEARAQSDPTLDSLRRTHPRIGKNFGFFITTETPGDRWPWRYTGTSWPLRTPNYPPTHGDCFNDTFRYMDNSFLDTLGLNCDNRSYYDAPTDT